MEKKMASSRLILFFILSLILLFEISASAADLYKVLGVERNASQRDIQKAFHKLSLKYHPDKNKAKDAQAAFAEINNAYEILSDEEKRKNYDLYGNENGAPRSEGSNHGTDAEDYTYFTGGEGSGRFKFRPGGQWQRMDVDGHPQSFSFSFGGDPGATGGFSSFGNIFSNIFGDDYGLSGSFFSGFSGARLFSKPSMSIQSVNSNMFKEEISGQGLTWMLLFYMPVARGYEVLEPVIADVAKSLQGAVKVGRVNCHTEQGFCKELGALPSRSPRLFSYSYTTSEMASLVEYYGDWDAKSIKIFCQERLPRFSKRIDIDSLKSVSSIKEDLPKVLLLSTKEDTPVIWRALSGLYRKQIIFYDAQVNDKIGAGIKSLGIDALPAIVGWLLNGEMHILRTGPVKGLKSGMDELHSLLDSFWKKNKKVVSSQNRPFPSQVNKEQGDIPELTSGNINVLSSEKVAVCIIGIFRSLKAKEKLESILSTVSQKGLMRRKNSPYSSKKPVSYFLLDASKHQSFLSGFGKNGFKFSDMLILAYKPQKEKFATLKDPSTDEEVERYISSILSGDVQFSKV